QHRRATEDDNEPKAHPLHWLDPAPRQPETSELRQPSGNSDASGCKKATGDRVDDQKQDRRQEVAEQLPEGLFQRCLPFIYFPCCRRIGIVCVALVPRSSVPSRRAPI